MLQVDMTPNHLGFKISGDFDALDELYDAVFALTVSDDLDEGRSEGTPGEQLMCTRLLALCYDIRHACQGSRGVEFVYSGMHEEHARVLELPFVEKNVVFSVEIIYPEAMYEIMVLNYLIYRRENILSNQKPYRTAWEENATVLLDPTICTVRYFQSRLLEAVGSVVSTGRFSRIRKQVNTNYHYTPYMYTQWLDLIDSDFASMTPKQRLEGMSTVVRDLADFSYNEQYKGLVKSIDKYAEKEAISRANVEIPNLSYPEDIEW